MLNSVTLIGRLANHPEMRYTQNGVAVATFTLAVGRSYTNQQGERETDFIDIVVWRKLAEVVANNLSKGRLVAVNGRLEIQRYETQDGQKRRAAKVVADRVVFLDYAKGQAQQGSYDPATGGEAVQYNPDEIPFY